MYHTTIIQNNPKHLMQEMTEFDRRNLTVMTLFFCEGENVLKCSFTVNILWFIVYTYGHLSNLDRKVRHTGTFHYTALSISNSHI